MAVVTTATTTLPEEADGDSRAMAGVVDLHPPRSDVQPTPGLPAPLLPPRPVERIILPLGQRQFVAVVDVFEDDGEAEATDGNTGTHMGDAGGPDGDATTDGDQAPTAISSACDTQSISPLCEPSLPGEESVAPSSTTDHITVPSASATARNSETPSCAVDLSVRLTQMLAVYQARSVGDSSMLHPACFAFERVALLDPAQVAELNAATTSPVTFNGVWFVIPWSESVRE